MVGSEPQLRRVYMEAATLISALRAGEAALVLQRLDQEAAEGWERQLWRGRAEFLWAVHADRLGDASAVLDHCQAARELLQSKPDGVAAETMPPAASGPAAGYSTPRSKPNCPYSAPEPMPPLANLTMRSRLCWLGSPISAKRRPTSLQQ